MPNIDWWMVLNIIFIILIALIFMMLLSFLKKRRRQKNGGSADQSDESQDGDGEWQLSDHTDPPEVPNWLRREIEAAKALKAQRDTQKADSLAKALKGEPLLAEFVQQQVGMQHLPIESLLDDRQQVLALSRKLPADLVDVLQVAARQTAVSLNLGREVERIAVNYPTRDMEPERMAGPEDLANILPEQYILSDDQFYADLATNNLRKLKAYETRTFKKAAYLLIDSSGSMDERMSNGVKRHIWARGITVNLLAQAVEGQAKYWLRTFDSRPHQLQMANDKNSAFRLMDEMTTEAFSGGGTSIQSALAQATDDLSNHAGRFDTTDVVLITDGEDNQLNSEFLHMLRSSGIQLHVLLLGVDNELLKWHAASCKRFD